MTFDVSSMLPHDHPMILTDELISSDSNSAVVGAIIKSDYPFVAGSIGTWVGLEFMAQAAALLAKLSNSGSCEDAKLGFLLGSRGFVAHVPEFVPGQKVLISITLDPNDIAGPIVNALGVIKDVNGGVLCDASLTLYEPNDDALYLKL